MQPVGGQNRNWSDPKSGKARTESRQSRFGLDGLLRQIGFVVAVVVVIGGLFLLFGFLGEGNRTARWVFWGGLILTVAATIAVVVRRRSRRQSLNDTLRSPRG